jgi:hypothetical protein
MKLKAFVVIIGIFLAGIACFADDSSKLVGTWKLVSFDVEIQATGKTEPAMGKNPTGYVFFTPERRVFFILTGEGRKPAKTEKEKAELLNSVVSYTGMYRLEGDKLITKVDVAWNPDFLGTEQTRLFKVEGNRLQLMTPWNVHPNWPERGMTRRTITFERAK